MVNNFNALYEVLAQNACNDNYKDKMYIITPKEYITYYDAWEAVKQIATYIEAENTSHLSIHIQSDNIIDYILSFWATSLLKYDIYLAVPPGEKIFYPDYSIIHQLRTVKRRTENINIDKRISFSIFFNSSGTTGVPHFIVNTETQFLNSISSARSYKPMQYLKNSENTYMSVSPAHSYGLSSLIEFTAYAHTIYYPLNFDLINQLQSVQLYSPNLSSLTLTPFLSEQILTLLPRLIMKKLKHIVLGTDFIAKEHLCRLLDKYPDVKIYCRYGLTELPSAVSVQEISSENIASANPQRITTTLDIYELYVKSRVKSGELIIKDLFLENDSLTGDFVEKIDDGYILHGRCSAIFKHRGYKVNPYQIEESIKNMDNIIDCVIFKTDTKLMLIIESNNTITLKTMYDLWNREISNEFKPDVIKFVDKLDRTMVGKKIRYNYGI